MAIGWANFSITTKNVVMLRVLLSFSLLVKYNTKAKLLNCGSILGTQVSVFFTYKLSNL